MVKMTTNVIGAPGKEEIKRNRNNSFKGIRARNFPQVGKHQAYKTQSATKLKKG